LNIDVIALGGERVVEGGGLVAGYNQRVKKCYGGLGWLVFHEYPNDSGLSEFG
jgi:hypothetical protein